jgi:hypothetical protein
VASVPAENVSGLERVVVSVKLPLLPPAGSLFQFTLPVPHVPLEDGPPEPAVAPLVSQ